MKQLLFTSILFVSFFCNAQFKTFDVKDSIVNSNTKYIIYLNAVWCKPCMDDMPAIIDSFKNIPNYKLIVLFERSYLDEKLDLQKKLKEKFGDSLFYFIPQRYYSGQKFISINFQNKAIKRFIKEINEVAKTKINFYDYAWGHLAVLKKGTYKVAKNIDKQTQIEEINKIINE